MWIVLERVVGKRSDNDKRSSTTWPGQVPEAPAALPLGRVGGPACIRRFGTILCACFRPEAHQHNPFVIAHIQPHTDHRQSDTPQASQRAWPASMSSRSRFRAAASCCKRLRVCGGISAAFKCCWMQVFSTFEAPYNTFVILHHAFWSTDPPSEKTADEFLFSITCRDRPIVLTDACFCHADKPALPGWRLEASKPIL